MIVTIPKFHKKNLYGNGIGGFLKTLTSRFLRPNIINPIAKKLGKETLALTKDTLTDVVHAKKPLKKSFKKNLKRTKARLIKEAKEKVFDGPARTRKKKKSTDAKRGEGKKKKSGSGRKSRKSSKRSGEKKKKKGSIFDGYNL